MGERCGCEICEYAKWECHYTSFFGGPNPEVVWELIGCKVDCEPDSFTGRCSCFELVEDI